MSVAAVGRLEQMGDRLSPMLVKELRQGVKSRGFGLAFLLMQGLLVFSVLIGSAEASTRRGAMDFSQAVFWICTGLPLLVIMPLRALFALQEEFRGNTLELLFLTRLSAWRIVVGKWFALFSQSLLLATGILPYLLLRYFLGGIDVATDLQAFTGILFGSALLCAAGICLSSFRTTGVRVLAGVAAGVLPFYVMGAVVNSRSRPAYGASTHAIQEHLVLAGYLLAAALLTALLLVWAADRINPPARSLASVKRLLAALLTLWCAAAAWYLRAPGLLFQSLVVILPVCVEALSEPLRNLPAFYAGWARRRPAVRAFRYLLQPGWPSGALFTIHLCLLLGLLAAGIGVVAEGDWMVLLTLPLALLGPLAPLVWMRPDSRRLTAAYIVSQLILLVLGFVIISINAFKTLPLWIFAWLPTTSFILSVFERYKSESGLPLAGLALAATLIPLAVRVGQALRRVRQWESAPAD